MLADAISYIRQVKGATRVVDVATLTGAIVVALGHVASGVMGDLSAYGRRRARRQQGHRREDVAAAHVRGVQAAEPQRLRGREEHRAAAPPAASPPPSSSRSSPTASSGPTWTSPGRSCPAACTAMKSKAPPESPRAPSSSSWRTSPRTRSDKPARCRADPPLLLPCSPMTPSGPGDGMADWKNQALLRRQPRHPQGTRPGRERRPRPTLDPPFNSNATYNVLFKEAGGEGSAAQIHAFDDPPGTGAWSPSTPTRTS